MCGGNGSSCAGCDGAPNSGAKLDACGVCGGDGSSCLGCDGVANSGAKLDACGECDGDGSSCLGCDGVAKSSATEDRCGVCAGDGSSCARWCAAPPPPPSPRTKWTRRVPHPVLIGHAAPLSQVRRAGRAGRVRRLRRKRLGLCVGGWRGAARAPECDARAHRSAATAPQHLAPAQRGVPRRRVPPPPPLVLSGHAVSLTPY